MSKEQEERFTLADSRAKGFRRACADLAVVVQDHWKEVGLRRRAARAWLYCDGCRSYWDNVACSLADFPYFLEVN